MRDRCLSRWLLLLRDERAEMRRDAVWQLNRRLSRKRLSRKQRDRALGVLARLLREDPDPGVRSGAAYALSWQNGSIDPTGVLVAAADADPDPNVRGYALEGLAMRWGRGCRRAARPALRHAPRFQAVADVVERGLQSSESVVRFWAVYAVGQIELVEFRPAVERLLGDEGLGLGELLVGDEAKSVLENLPVVG